jgi:G:T/U-mismatch repair DNA glycosylase
MRKTLFPLLAIAFNNSKVAFSFVPFSAVGQRSIFTMTTTGRETSSRFFHKRPLLTELNGTKRNKSQSDETESETKFKSMSTPDDITLVNDVSSSANRTHSFPPQVNSDTSIKIHTLILGTHPSITSLAKVQYFGHPQNAFWWIAGDCLGFRRSAGISPSSGKPYKLTNYLWHGEDKVIPYEEQIEALTLKGFALWDLFQSCERKGSLDNDIKDGKPNNIREFCLEHGTINRIIMANGAKQCDFFNKYFEQWWLDGGLRPGRNELSQKAFGKWSKRTNGFQTSGSSTSRSTEGMRPIEVYCMPGVSPAAASVSYEEKRKEFQKYCYDPGMMDHERLSISNGTSG